MANTKISALTSASTPLAGTEVLPIVQSGATVKVASNDLTVRNVRANATTGILQVTGPAAASTRVMTVPDANFTAARTDAAQSFTGNQTLSTGNLVIGTSGKGIDFSATAGTGTSELLADYEEGTWAAVLSDGTNTVALGNGTYTKIGRSVFLILDAYSKSMAGLNTAANLTITGIPFTPVNSSINAWIPSLNVASTSFAISCATSGIMYPLRTNNSVDFNLTPLSVFGSPGTMTWQFTANYSV